MELLRVEVDVVWVPPDPSVQPLCCGSHTGVSWCISLVVCPPPFLLPVCLSILSLGLGRWANREAADLSHLSLCLQKPGLQPPSLHVFPKSPWVRHSQALCCFNGFFLIMQMFPGRSRDCIATDFYMVSVPPGSVHSSSGWEMSIYILLDQCALKSWHATIIVICHPHYLWR